MLALEAKRFRYRGSGVSGAGVDRLPDTPLPLIIAIGREQSGFNIYCERHLTNRFSGFSASKKAEPITATSPPAFQTS